MANLDGLKPNLVGFYNELKQFVPEATITSGKRTKPMLNLAHNEVSINCNHD